MYEAGVCNRKPEELGLLTGSGACGVYRDYPSQFRLRVGRSLAMFIRNYGWQLPRGALIIINVSMRRGYLFFLFVADRQFLYFYRTLFGEWLRI